jgi:hypothetical protein
MNFLNLGNGKIISPDLESARKIAKEVPTEWYQSNPHPTYIKSVKSKLSIIPTCVECTVPFIVPLNV